MSFILYVRMSLQKLLFFKKKKTLPFFWIHNIGIVYSELLYAFPEYQYIIYMEQHYTTLLLG